MPLEPDRSNAPLYAPDSSRESRDRAWVESIRTGDVAAFEAMFRAYAEDVRAGRFPGPEQCYRLDPADEAEIREARERLSRTRS